MNFTAKNAVGKLKLEHRTFGLMIDELDQAVGAFTGQELVNAIDEIASRYSYPIS